MDTTIVVCDGAADGQNLNNALPLCIPATLVCALKFIQLYIIHWIVIIYSIAFRIRFHTIHPAATATVRHPLLAWATLLPTFDSPHRSAVVENTQEFSCFIGIFYFHFAFSSIVLGCGLVFVIVCFPCAQYVRKQLTRFNFRARSLRNLRSLESKIRRIEKCSKKITHF